MNQLGQASDDVPATLDAEIRQARFRMRLLMGFYLVTRTRLFVYGIIGLVVLIHLKDQIRDALNALKLRTHEAMLLGRNARSASSVSHIGHLASPKPADSGSGA